MKIVIDIDEKTMKNLKTIYIKEEVSEEPVNITEIVREVANGKPLPKGHGDLIDELCRLRSDLKSGLHVGSTLRTQAQMNKYIGVLDAIINNAPTVDAIVNTIEVRPQGELVRKNTVRWWAGGTDKEHKE